MDWIGSIGLGWTGEDLLTRQSRWKDPENVYRKQWGVKALPQLVRYQRVGGEVKATGELVENEVNDDEKLAKFVGA